LYQLHGLNYRQWHILWPLCLLISEAVHLKNPANGNGYPRKLLLIDDEHALEGLMNHEFAKMCPYGQQHEILLQYILSLFL